MATFMQSIPAGNWKLLNDDKKAPQLHYQNDDGNQITVPSIWYNQPIAWRVDYFRFCATRNREGAARLLASPDPIERSRAALLLADAARLEADAATMERTGQFIDQPR